MTAEFEKSRGSHEDVIEQHNRFHTVRFAGTDWNLAHLNSFSIRLVIEVGLSVDVVVLFSCHCFTHAVEHDPRSPIPVSELYWDGRERRVLNEERYRLSRKYLPELIRELPRRQIRVVPARGNYFTLELVAASGETKHYAVFFEVKKDKTRKKRLLLRVQSAYPVEKLDKRHTSAKKVNFTVLLRATYQGRRIRG